MASSKNFLGKASTPDGLEDFFFLRHGKTDLNEVLKVIKGEKHWGVQGGGTNISLNAKGVSQALAAGMALQKLAIDNVVCSPLARAVQTATLACPGKELEIEDDLKERDFGRHEGGLGPVEMFEEDYEDCEETEAFSMRVAMGLEHARAKGTLLVAHGNWLRAAAGLLGAELLPEHLGNGIVLHFTQSDVGWTVKAHHSPVVLVSGANRGIGKAIADELLAKGYRVSLGARDVAKLEDAFGKENDALHFARFDADEESTMADWVNSAIEKFGGIDALVNNAGSGTDGKVNLMHDNDEGLDEVLDVHVKAAWRMTRLCMPHLAEVEGGRIININSLSGLRIKNSRNVGYNIAKMGQMALNETTKFDGWDKGVRTAAICPGWVATDLSAATCPLSRDEIIPPQKVAEAVRFAIERPDNAWTSTLPINCEYEPIY